MYSISNALSGTAQRQTQVCRHVSRQQGERRLYCHARGDDASKTANRMPGMLKVIAIPLSWAGALFIATQPAVCEEMDAYFASSTKEIMMSDVKGDNKNAEEVFSSIDVPVTTTAGKTGEDGGMSSDATTTSNQVKGLEEQQETKSSKRKGRIRELEEIKAELAKKELELLSKENALLEKEQSMLVLRQELEIEKNLRALITKEKEQAEEEAALAMGLCTGSTMLP